MERFSACFWSQDASSTSWEQHLNVVPRVGLQGVVSRVLRLGGTHHKGGFPCCCCFCFWCYCLHVGDTATASSVQR